LISLQIFWLEACSFKFVSVTEAKDDSGIFVTEAKDYIRPSVRR
jgi:hypothetical protein